MKKMGVWLWCMGVWGIGQGFVLPEAVQMEGRHLYRELELERTVGWPAFQKAWEGYAQYGPSELLAVIDFTKPSAEERLCVVDLKHRKVLFRSHVAHGRGSGENYATAFSNEPGSFKSALGFYRTGSAYTGRNGYSLRLDGLEKGVNDRARERAIVMHGAAYADPGVLRSQKRLGRSLGCPALPPALSRKIIDAIKGGTLLYIYGQAEEKPGAGTCPVRKKLPG